MILFTVLIVVCDLFVQSTAAAKKAAPAKEEEEDDEEESDKSKSEVNDEDDDEGSDEVYQHARYFVLQVYVQLVYVHCLKLVKATYCTTI